MIKIIYIVIFKIISISNKFYNYIAYNFSLSSYKKLGNDYKKCEKIKLHFGCGPRVLKDWINIDLFFEPYKNYLKFYGDEYYPFKIRGDKKDFYAINIIKTGLPLPDNSVDVIFHEDFIEHLNQKEQIIFLSETFRVLKQGGVHRINTPDLVSSMSKNSNFSEGLKGVYQYEWDKNGHKNLFTKESLEEVALMIGYSKILFNNKNESISKVLPREYRPDVKDRSDDGNIFADLIK